MKSKLISPVQKEYEEKQAKFGEEIY
jgi:hypothetical protein